MSGLYNALDGLVSAEKNGVTLDEAQKMYAKKAAVERPVGDSGRVSFRGMDDEIVWQVSSPHDASQRA